MLHFLFVQPWSYIWNAYKWFPIDFLSVVCTISLFLVSTKPLHTYKNIKICNEALLFILNCYTILNQMKLYCQFALHATIVQAKWKGVSPTHTHKKNIIQKRFPLHITHTHPKTQSCTIVSHCSLHIHQPVVKVHVTVIINN